MASPSHIVEDDRATEGQDSTPIHDDRKRSHDQFAADNDDNDTPAIRGGNKKSKNKGSMGRKEYYRNNVDRRQRNTNEVEKRKARELAGEALSSLLPGPFTEEEIAKEERKPKRKVAVYIGYSGTGYKGLQISTTEKTIEGDLFKAFVEAGAISKANASDPKKSQFVRCARTDKGVHASGNLISVNLIIEDPDIVQKINDRLSPQIRVWGLQRTNKSFNCYSIVDSRWYEYLLPTHTLIPPHPRSYLGQKLLGIAKEHGDLEGYESRQADMKGFWEEVDSTKIQPILDTLDKDFRPLVEEVLYHDSSNNELGSAANDAGSETATIEADALRNGSISNGQAEENSEKLLEEDKSEAQPQEGQTVKVSTDVAEKDRPYLRLTPEQQTAFHESLRILRKINRDAKLSYRVGPERLKRLQAFLDAYQGTNNYHNYTEHKSFKDASAKRHIKSFVSSEPFVKHGSEWVSLKVHGQSFMMHQIRKMVGMAVLGVRCGSTENIIPDSFTNIRLVIPKAPPIGLLLERPVFNSFNEKMADTLEREKIDFGKYEKEIEAFKQREIYEKIWELEEEKAEFYAFFKHVDGWKEEDFLYLSSKGIEAVRKIQRTGPQKQKRKRVDSDDDEPEQSRGSKRGAKVELEHG